MKIIKYNFLKVKEEYIQSVIWKLGLKGGEISRGHHAYLQDDVHNTLEDMLKYIKAYKLNDGGVYWKRR